MNDEYMKVSINDHSFRLRYKKSVSKADIYICTSTYCMEKQVSVEEYTAVLLLLCLLYKMNHPMSNVLVIGVFWIFIFIQKRMNDSFRGNLWVWFLLLLFSRAYMVRVFTFECVHGLFFSLFFFSPWMSFFPLSTGWNKEVISFILYAITRRGGVQTQ